jgi:hypothetical protein
MEETGSSETLVYIRIHGVDPSTAFPKVEAEDPKGAVKLSFWVPGTKNAI